MLKRNRLVAYHTDSVLIINVDINIIRSDMNETNQWCVVFIYILLYTTYNTLHAQIHVRYNLTN